MRDAERFAKLITIENGKALPDSRGEVACQALDASARGGVMKIRDAEGSRVVPVREFLGSPLPVVGDENRATGRRESGPRAGSGSPASGASPR